METPLESLHEFNTMAEAMFTEAFSIFSAALPPVAGVERSVEVIRGVDGNDITLYIHRPAHAQGPLPGILHLHGGGMTILEASSASYQRWRDHPLPQPRMRVQEPEAMRQIAGAARKVVHALR